MESMVGRTRHYVGMAMVVLVLLTAPGSAVRATSATPTPAGAPGVTDAAGCGRLPAYFRAANALTAGNEGLRILKVSNYDVPALTDEQASTVVASLDALLAGWDRLAPPPAAQAWHEASRDLFAWYRDMAANRSHLDHQRLINGDKTVVPALGRATIAGQRACGYEVWNAAIATAPATPAP